MGGYYLWFRIEQSHIKNEIKKEVKEGLNNEDLVVITVPFNDESSIEWVEKDKEFIYHGEMYDVVKTRSDGRIKQYFCINDKKEEKLIADFCNKDNTHRKTENKAAKTFNHLFFSKINELTLWDITKEKPSPCVSLIYTSACKEILNPPPESFC